MSELVFPVTKLNKKLAGRIFLHDLSECVKFPKYFEIETVHACNARCIMCSIKDWEKRRSSFMDMELFVKFTEEVKPYSDWIETVCLCRDGEPTLDRHLSERVRMLKDVGIRKVTFSTNGQLLTPKLVEQLIEAGLDDIMVSIDGFTKETFEKIRIGLSYEKVLNNTLELIRLRNNMNSRMTIRIRMVILDENRDEVEDWFLYWKEKVGKSDQVYAKKMHTWGNQFGKEMQEKVAYYADRPCVAPFSTIFMHVDGKVPLCGMDYNSIYLMGDFLKQTIKEIWNGDTYAMARSRHAGKKRNEISMCRGCNLWEPEFQVGRKI